MGTLLCMPCTTLFTVYNYNVCYICTIDSLFPEALSTCDILRCIYSVVSEWFRLGLELRVPASTLEAIEYDHRGDVETCRRKMVQEWLKQPCSSWCSLIEALKRVGLERVADEISRECLKSK